MPKNVIDISEILYKGFFWKALTILAIETNKGNRPSFSKAADPEKGEELFEELKFFLDESFENYQSGIFGEDMNIEIVNEGPVTFLFKN